MRGVLHVAFEAEGCEWLFLDISISMEFAVVFFMLSVTFILSYQPNIFYQHLLSWFDHMTSAQREYFPQIFYAVMSFWSFGIIEESQTGVMRYHPWQNFELCSLNLPVRLYSSWISAVMNSHIFTAWSRMWSLASNCVCKMCTVVS